MEKSRLNIKPESLLWILLAAWWVINLVQAAFTELANDEAYYWMFAQNLDWGYFDHPPMTALLVKMGSFMGGGLGVRLFFTILQPLYLYIIYRIVKPADVTNRDVALFVVICAALPILQLYGFIAVPDGPLLFFSALFLLSFKWLTEKNRWIDAILMGISIAALAYSKYHSVLVVIFALLAYPRIFRNPKLYIAGVIAMVAIVPHLMWQSNHDWVSIRYHLTGRNANFSLDYFMEYLLNIVAVFNPLFFPLYIKRWIKTKAQSPVQRAIYTITLGFILFFLVSNVRGYVQPQWVIPSVFGAILLLWRYGIENQRVRKYTMVAGLITISLVALFRIEMIFNPLGIKFEIFDNQASYGAIAKVADGRPVVFVNGYAMAAKYQYCTANEAYSQASAWHRSSQWQFRDDDTEMAGKQIVAEVHRDEDADAVIELSNGKTFRYKVVDDFRPVRRVSIEFDPNDVPQVVRRGDIVAVLATFENPYPYEITLSTDSLALTAVFRFKTLATTEAQVAMESVTLKPGKRTEARVRIAVPKDLAVGKYSYGLTIRTPYMPYWFNSKTYNITVE